MKKTLRTLFAVLALTLCLCLPAFAQEAKPAQPAAKEDKTVTDLTGRDAFLRDVKGFTTNFGGPYHFAQADHKSPAQVPGRHLRCCPGRGFRGRAAYLHHVG